MPARRNARGFHISKMRISNSKGLLFPPDGLALRCRNVGIRFSSERVPLICNAVFSLGVCPAQLSRSL